MRSMFCLNLAIAASILLPSAVHAKSICLSATFNASIAALLVNAESIFSAYAT